MSTHEIQEGREQSGPFSTRHRIGVGWTLAVSVVALIVITITSAIAWDGSVSAWEESVLLFFNGWPNWFEPPMWVLQQVGVTGAPVVAAVGVYYFTRRWEHLVAFVAVLPMKLVLEKGVIKNLVERDRPFQSVGDHINVRGPAFEGLSFPSGHTTTIFGVSVLLFAILPSKWRPIPLIWATIVAIARLYYGEHNFLDVVAGAATGTLFGVILWFAFLNRVVDEDVDEQRDEMVTES